MSADSILRPKIQLKSRRPDSSLLSLLHSHHTILFLSRYPDGSLTKSSDDAVVLIRKLGVDARKIAVADGSALEVALQSYSGWQYFPQLYVAAEFIGGTIVMEEFFYSMEYARILLTTGVIEPTNTIKESREPRDATLSAIWKMSLSVDENYLVVARANGSIELVQISNRSVCMRVTSHHGWVNSARFNIGGDCFYSGGSDTVLKLWNIGSASVTHATSTNSRWVNDIAVDPNSKYVASVGADRTIRFWSPTTLALLWENRFHESNIWCALATEDVLVTGDEDGTVVLTDAVDYSQRSNFHAHGNGITAMSVAPAPAMFCTTGFDGMVYGWSLQGSLMFQYSGHSERVWSACQVDDGRAIASACADGSVDVWNPMDGQCMHQIRYSATPLALCYVRREKVLVIGHSDGTLTWSQL